VVRKLAVTLLLGKYAAEKVCTSSTMMPPTHFANSVRNHLDTAFWDHWFGHMAMCGNHIQRVKIVINNNIIEQVTYFKYLGYCISEYKSNLEDKLQTYNKIN
jgi:hypothetical protein